LLKPVCPAEALGFIIVVRGIGGIGAARHPNQFRLTYLPGQNGGSPSDEWSEIRSEEDARARLAGVKRRPPRKRLVQKRQYRRLSAQKLKTPQYGKTTIRGDACSR